MTEPVVVKKKARDVTPYHHSIWCTVMSGEPFANEICSRKWSENGKQIVFMLESFNFLFADPDEEIEVIETTSGMPAEVLERAAKEDVAKMRANIEEAEMTRMMAL